MASRWPKMMSPALILQSQFDHQCNTACVARKTIILEQASKKTQWEISLRPRPVCGSRWGRSQGTKFSNGANFQVANRENWSRATKNKLSLYQKDRRPTSDISTSFDTRNNTKRIIMFFQVKTCPCCFLCSFWLHCCYARASYSSCSNFTAKNTTVSLASLKSSKLESGPIFFLYRLAHLSPWTMV